MSELAKGWVSGGGWLPTILLTNQKKGVGQSLDLSKDAIALQWSDDYLDNVGNGVIFDGDFSSFSRLTLILLGVGQFTPTFPRNAMIINDGEEIETGPMSGVPIYGYRVGLFRDTDGTLKTTVKLINYSDGTESDAVLQCNYIVIGIK